MKSLSFILSSAVMLFMSSTALAGDCEGTSWCIGVHVDFLFLLEEDCVVSIERVRLLDLSIETATHKDFSECNGHHNSC